MPDEQLKQAMRIVPLLRWVTRERVNALLPDDGQLSVEQWQHLLIFSFMQPGQRGRYEAHDLVRQASSAWLQMDEPRFYIDIHRQAKQWCADEANKDANVEDIIYHWLAFDQDAAMRLWLQEMMERRQRYDQVGQNRLLDIVKTAERWNVLEAKHHATWFYRAGLLYLFQDKLRDTEHVFERALPLYREIEDRLGEANTLRSLSRFYYRQNQLEKAEAMYHQALALFEEIGDRYSCAATLTYRSIDRLAKRQPIGMVDWANALSLALATDVFLFQQIIGMVWGRVYAHLNGKEYALLAAGAEQYLAAVKDIVEGLHFDGQQAGTINIFNDAIAVVGAIANWQESDPNNHEQREQFAQFARSTATAVDQASDNAFDLQALTTTHLPHKL